MALFYRLLKKGSHAVVVSEAKKGTGLQATGPLFIFLFWTGWTWAVWLIPNCARPASTFRSCALREHRGLTRPPSQGG